jgi:ATP-dependent helicase HrpB
MSVLEDHARGARPGGVNVRGVQTVAEAAKALSKRLRKGSGEADETEVRKIILSSQKDRLCRRRGIGERGLMVGGRGVKLGPNTQVRKSEFFVALQGVDLPGQTETTVGMACGMTKGFVLEQLREEIEIREEVDFVEEKGQFFNARVRIFRDLPLEEPTLTPVDPSLVADRIARF